MIFLNNASLQFGGQKIFDNISFSFFSGQKIGLVGLNGSGKTTLLKVLAGLIKLDSGELQIQKNVKISYMPQEIILLSDKTVFDETFTVFENFLRLERRKEELEKMFDSNSPELDKFMEEYVEILDVLKDFDKQAAVLKTEEILFGLGFSRDNLSKAVSSLSVGWKMRLVLAKLLLNEADFYLFDEPTNHLDIVTKEWFFNLLKKSSFGYLLVSHDKYFLENACDYIFELDHGNGNLFNGSFSSYLEQKDHQNKLLEAKFLNQQKEIAQKEKTIERFRSKSSKAKMVKSMIKKLDKIEKVELNQKPKTVNFNFPETERSGRIVLEFKNLNKSFGNHLIFKNISCVIERGEKVALVAANGVGKTTLFNIIVGKYQENYEIVFGHNVKYAIFEQDQVRSLNQENTIFEEVLQSCSDIQEQKIRDFLGTFLFSNDDIHKKISVLSGGERNRVGMVKVLLQRANFLILDEPTNHLDIYAKDILLNALQEYKGTLLFVSHDYDFINKLATRILHLTSNKLYSYNGNYESYLIQKRYHENGLSTQLETINNVLNKDKNEDFKKKENTKKQVRVIESKIAKIEKEIENIQGKFAACDYNSDQFKLLMEKLKLSQQLLNDHLIEWENLQKFVDES